MVDTTKKNASGYKRTEVGLIPIEWDVFKLEDLIEEKKQKNKNKNQHPVYTISNVYGFISSDKYFDKQVYSKDLSTYKLINYDDFAYNPYRVNVGSLALYAKKTTGLVSSAYVVFKTKGNLSSQYLLFLLKSNKWLNEIMRASMSRGSVRRSLSYKDLANFYIPVPPITEQRTIAHILSTIQQAIEATDRVITAAQELKKSLMQHLFTYGPVSLEEAEQVPLKETEMGMIPEHWDISKLSQAIEEPLFNGLFVKNPVWGGGTLYLNVADVYKSATVNPVLLKRIHIPEETILKYSLQDGDILFVRSSLKREGVAKACLVENIKEPIVFDCHLIRARPNKELIVPRFFVEYCRSYKGHNDLISLSKTTTMTTVPQANISSFKFPLPQLSEQYHIANILNVLDKKKDVEEKRKNNLQSLFNSMLHHLMTGQLRVKDLDLNIPEEVAQ